MERISFLPGPDTAKEDRFVYLGQGIFKKDERGESRTNCHIPLVYSVTREPFLEWLAKQPKQ